MTLCLLLLLPLFHNKLNKLTDCFRIWDRQWKGCDERLHQAGVTAATGRGAQACACSHVRASRRVQHYS